MANKLDPKELVSFKELLMSEVIHSEALVNLLDRKGIITKEGTLGGDEKGAGDLAEKR
jgi:hypothetical protein